jgi:hypothetical protein
MASSVRFPPIAVVYGAVVNDSFTPGLDSGRLRPVSVFQASAEVRGGDLRVIRCCGV